MDEVLIEQRLERVVGLYDKLTDIINNLPIKIPKQISEKLIKSIIDDKDLKHLIEGIKNRRPPKFILIGRTGSGKSSLINAMAGKYLAKTSDVKTGTKFGQVFQYKHFGKTLFEIIDTRGVGESSSEVDNGAEEVLQEDVIKFSPDAVLFLVNSKSRAYIKDDIQVLIKIMNEVKDIPVIVLATQVDELEPAREKDPKNYPERKLRNINEAVNQLINIFTENKVDVLDILPVSSYIEWDVDDPTQTPEEDRHKLNISYDGRFNINKLLDLLEDNIDIKAGIFLTMVARLDQVTRKIADKLTKIFAGIAGVIAVTPIPFSDVFILTALQVVLVMMIASLSGKDINYDNAKELLIAIGGTGAVGYGLRFVFQQGSKLANLIFPGAGSGLSAAIASSGTWAIGKAATAYFIQEVPQNQLEDVIKKAHKEYDKLYN